MPVEVIMPKVDMDMDRGRIVIWHVGDGAAVEKGAPLFDIETDKAAMEVESPAAGMLHHRAPEGSEVPIGQPVAWLYAADEAVGPPPTKAASAPDRPEAPAPGDAGSGVATIAASGGIASGSPDTDPCGATDATPDAAARRVRATPAARAQARAAGLAVSGVVGTGPRGRVQAADVDAARTASRPATVDGPAPLAVTRRGGGTGTPVVLLHGFAADSMSWAALEPHLAGRSVVRIDLPGHGRSAPQDGMDFAALVASLCAAFDGLGLDRAHLVGHSLGGALALALADTRPRQVASLTMIAPAGLGPQIDGAVLSGICRATRVESLAPWLRRLVADPRQITDSYARLAMEARRDPALRAAQSSMIDALFPDGTQAFDLTAALDRLVPPARIIWGKADAVIPFAHALRAPGRVALHLFDRIGHMPQIECPEEVGKLIAQSL